jgi:hypothetical protein
MTYLENNYSEIIEKIGIIIKWILLDISDKVESNKDVFLRNSLAKSFTLLESIQKLYRQELFNEGWILFRSLLDRLIYIYHLSENDLYDNFEDWTYLQKFKLRNDIRADERFKRVLKDPFFNINREESNKNKELKKKEIKWNKPEPRVILKKYGLDFLYKFGYYIASMHTHPMATDGEAEFHKLTGLEPNPYKDFDHTTLIKNSILINTLIQQVIFNNLDFRFRGLVYSFLEETRKNINSEQNNFDLLHYQLLKLVEKGISWQEK